jgi:hypothetical protein
MCCFLCVTSCLNNDLKSDVNDYLQESDYSKLFSVINYPKNPSKELIRIRFKSLINSGLISLDSVRNKSSTVYTIHLIDSVKNLLYKESVNSYSIIGKTFFFKTVDSLNYRGSYSHFLAYTTYSLKSVSEIYELDDFTFDSKDLLQNPTIILKFKKTLFGISLLSIESSNIYPSRK